MFRRTGKSFVSPPRMRTRHWSTRPVSRRGTIMPMGWMTMMPMWRWRPIPVGIPGTVGLDDHRRWRIPTGRHEIAAGNIPPAAIIPDGTPGTAIPCINCRTAWQGLDDRVARAGARPHIDIGCRPRRPGERTTRHPHACSKDQGENGLSQFMSPATEHLPALSERRNSPSLDNPGSDTWRNYIGILIKLGPVQGLSEPQFFAVS